MVANVLYMAVTPDKYELPIAVAEDRNTLSKMTGIPADIISSMIYHKRPGTTIGIRFCKVKEISDEEELVDEV